MRSWPMRRGRGAAIDKTVGVGVESRIAGREVRDRHIAMIPDKVVRLPRCPLVYAPQRRPPDEFEWMRAPASYACWKSGRRSREGRPGNSPVRCRRAAAERQMRPVLDGLEGDRAAGAVPRPSPAGPPAPSSRPNVGAYRGRCRHPTAPSLDDAREAATGRAGPVEDLGQPRWLQIACAERIVPPPSPVSARAIVCDNPSEKPAACANRRPG